MSTTPTPIAPTPVPSAAPILPATLAQPGAAAVPAPIVSNPTTDAVAAMGPYLQNEQTATQKAAAIANQPPPPPVPHQRLLDMIAGLGAGLSGFGTALATHGREGGAAETQAILGARQQQQIQAKQAATEQKNQQIQQQLMIANTNHTLAQNVLYMATLPDEISESHLKAASEQAGLAGEQQRQGIEQADFQAAHGGLKPAEFSAALSDTNPVGAQKTTNPFFVVNAQQTLDAAKTAGLPDTDPYVQRLQSMLAPNSPAMAKDLWLATNQLNNQRELQGKAVQEKAAKETAESADPVAKLSTPEALAAPGAQAAIQAKIADPNTDKEDIPRLQALIPRASLAQKNVQSLATATEQMKLAVSNGDPKAAGALLESGLVSPQELISSRQPKFAQEAFDEAVRLSGGKWSAVKAEAQYEYAKNEKTQNTLNLLTTMQNPGGSIDIASKQFDTIPGKVDEATFNKIVDGAIKEFGGKSVTDFQAAMTSLADEYAQVLQGGAATETTLREAKDLIKQSYTKTQGAGAFDVIRQDMAARQKGMVRDNPALMSMYPIVTPTPKVSDYAPRPANLPEGSKLMQVPGGQPHWMAPNLIDAAVKAGAVEVQ